MSTLQSMNHGQYGRTNRRLAGLANAALGKNLSLYNPPIPEIELLVDLAGQTIPGIAAPDKVISVYRHNPESFWAVSRVGSDGAALEWPEGFFAVLPLTDEGARALVGGRMNTADPDLRLICRQWERPAALYFWCIFAPGALSAGLALWANHYCAPKYQGVQVFAKAGTADGERFFNRLGFTPGAVWRGVRNDDFISVAPPAPAAPLDQSDSARAARPAYDDYIPHPEAEDALSCSVVSTIDELMQCMAIRSVVYIGEQNCPYKEEWDGNDLGAIHILARKGEEPVGAIRLRCFADFAKVERLAVLPAARRSYAAFNLERAACELARAMGYSRLLGHAHAHVVRFWRSRGWKVIEGRDPFVFSDHQCIEIEKRMTPHVDAIRFDADPYRVIRPVGRWSAPGPLDRSAARKAVNVAPTKEGGVICETLPAPETRPARKQAA